MDELTLDWETYYDSQYSLKNMPTVLYVRDDRFLIHGIGVQFNDHDPEWLTGIEMHKYLSQIDWPNTALIGHNLLFDALVLVEHYGFKPAEYRDTRYMANAFLPRGLSRGLDGTAAALNMGAKIKGTLRETKGQRDLGEDLLAKLGEYCLQDVTLTKQIHDTLWPNVPENEKRLMSMTTRHGVECLLELDVELLETELQEKTDEQRRLIEASGVEEAVLRSDKQFFALLQTVADDAPTKTNDSGKTIPALSKLDAQWSQFKAHHPELKALTDGREAAKSNILIKRPETFLEIAKAGNGKLPMPYLYCGAHTGRWSGCLTTGHSVIIRRDDRQLTVDITEVRHGDKVWDGIEFVEHDGLIYSGIRDVIHHDGITGTPDHKVLVRDKQPRYLSLEETKSRGIHIETGRSPDGARIETYNPWNDQFKNGRHSPLLKLRTREDQQSRDDHVEQLNALPELCLQAPANRDHSSSRRRGCQTDCARTLTTRETRNDRCAIQSPTSMGEQRSATLQQPQSSGVQRLWWAWDSLRLLLSICGDHLRLDNTRPQTRRYGDRSNRQRGALRPWQSALRYSLRKPAKQAQVPWRSVWAPHAQALSAATGLHIRRLEAIPAERDDGRRDYRNAERQRWAAPTYDILNCGPRHRFVANGKIVHNSGGINVQNIPSSRISRLRRAIRAPKGHVIHVSDSSQIELRFQLWFSGQHDLLEQLVRSDSDDSVEDLYVRNARNIFQTKEITKHMRGVGKALELGAQYGLGAKRYREYLAAGPLGLPPTAISEQEAQKHIRTYRETHPKTVEMWRMLDNYITAMMDGNCNYELGPLRFVHEAIVLPNGLWIDYSGLHHQPDGNAAYGSSKQTYFLFGGSCLENLTQGLARIPLGEWAVQIEKELPLRVVGWTHDEILAIGPESQAEENQKAMEAIMSQPLSWAPGLTLAAEGGFDHTYIDH